MRKIASFIESRKAALKDFWQDDLAREGLRDLCLVSGILVATVTTAMAIIPPPRKPPNCLLPIAQSYPEVIRPVAADSWSLSPFPILNTTDEDVQEDVVASDDHHPAMNAEKDDHADFAPHHRHRRHHRHHHHRRHWRYA